jgi:hypothetical protein
MQISTVVLYGCEVCALQLKDEHRLRAFENWVLKMIIAPKRKEITGENCIMRSFIICTTQINMNEMRGHESRMEIMRCIQNCSCATYREDRTWDAEAYIR